jgi:hypothetical protein
MPEILFIITMVAYIFCLLMWGLLGIRKEDQ